MVKAIDVEESFDDWRRKKGRLIMLVERDNESEEISVITESGTLSQLSLQADLYQSDEQEELSVDSLKTIQWYLKKFFRGAKFLSDTGKMFKEPIFVAMDGEKSQSVEICEYLWKSLGMN